jgi:hypothetical protein
VPPRVVAQCHLDHPGPVRLAFHRKQACAPPGSKSAEQGSFAAGTGAHVQPTLIGPGQRHGSEGESDELAALVLDAGPPLANGREISRISLGQHRGVGGPATRSSAGLQEFGYFGPPGPCDQGHLGSLIVSSESPVELVNVATE